MTTERTLVLVKPDGVQRGLAGEIIGRLERTGLQIIGMKLMQISDELASTHYGEHEGKPFYDSLLTYIHSGPVVATVWEGTGAVSLARKLIGATDPAQAAPGTIRGDFGLVMDENVVHGSDSVESAEREIPIFFPGLD